LSVTQRPSAAELLQPQIATLLAEILLVAPPAPETDLLAAGTLDSLSLVELFIQLEQRFRISVKMEDLEVDHFRSVTSIAAFVVGWQERAR